MDEKEKGEKNNGRMELWSKGVTLVRETILILLLVLLLLWPGSINSILVHAGFTEANFGGIVWKKELEESTEETQSALETVTQLKEQLEDVKTTLASVQKSTTQPEIRKSMDSALANVEALQDSATVVNKSLQQSYIKGRILLGRIDQESDLKSVAPAPRLKESVERPSGR